MGNIVYLVSEQCGAEYIYSRFEKPFREDGSWTTGDRFDNPAIELPKGTIEKLIGRKLTWEDEPVELKEED